jgi:hypothetical protein
MSSEKHTQIMTLVEALFKPCWIKIREERDAELFRARRGKDQAAIIAFEAACYTASAKELVLARARCIADAYSAFYEPVGEEAQKELTNFFVQMVQARKSSFAGEVSLRHIHVKASMEELNKLLSSFDPEVFPAVEEAQALLTRQAAELAGQSAPPDLETKYVLDVATFARVTEGSLATSELPADGGFAIPQLQAEEMKAAKDAGLRGKMMLAQVRLRARVVPNRPGGTRWECANWGPCTATQVLKELDLSNGMKATNPRDAVVAEAAMNKGCTLITADADVQAAVEKSGGKALLLTSARAAGQP